MSANEIYGRLKAMGNGSPVELVQLVRDETNYKALIVEAENVAEKLALAQRLATRRLACGVVPELDACFEALELAAST